MWACNRQGTNRCTLKSKNTLCSFIISTYITQGTPGMTARFFSEYFKNVYYTEQVLADLSFSCLRPLSTINVDIHFKRQFYTLLWCHTRQKFKNNSKSYLNFISVQLQKMYANLSLSKFVGFTIKTNKQIKSRTAAEIYKYMISQNNLRLKLIG